MNKITEITRRDILDIIMKGFAKDPDPLDMILGNGQDVNIVFMPFYGRLDEVEFLSRIYDLKKMKVYDSRFNNALDEITCHLRNGDLEDCWFFKDERFHLMKTDDDEPLLRLVCEMLHPAVRLENSPWKDYLNRFNKLLRADGYELFVSNKISGREVYDFREYLEVDGPLLPNNLFTERYKNLIHYGDGKAIDNISGNVNYLSKYDLGKIMLKFDEPEEVRRDRYNNWVDNTTALDEAISHFNDYINKPLIDLSLEHSQSMTANEILAKCFTPFIFDVIEFQFEELSNTEKEPFGDEINNSFQKNNLPFRLSDRGLIEFQVEPEVLSPEIRKLIDDVPEAGVRDLLNEAIEKHMLPNPQAHYDAVEKIWDALERLKTYYVDLDKKNSVNKIINQMSGGDPTYEELIDKEFKTLTNIGNKFCIRHHETNKIEISDPRYCDYFFNRCLSLIALAIQYLE
ncbi:MAG: AbiJ-NTD4 domain-containing protein [Eubacterium sp.]